MFIIVFLAAVVVGLALTALSALFAVWIAPETGLPYLAELDFVNWFFIVLLVHCLTWSSSFTANRSK